MRVLVVEDYTPLRLAIVKGLTDAGFSVDVAINGKDGLWHAQSGEHDVIILDLMLPEVDGLTILKELRAAKSEVHVLVLTAKDNVRDRIQGSVETRKLDRGRWFGLRTASFDFVRQSIGRTMVVGLAEEPEDLGQERQGTFQYKC